MILEWVRNSYSNAGLWGLRCWSYAIRVRVRVTLPGGIGTDSKKGLQISKCGRSVCADVV